MPCRKSQRIQRCLHRSLVAPGAHLLEACDLAFAHCHVVDVARLNRVFAFELVFVHAYDHVLPAVDAGLFFSRRRFNFQLGPAAINGLDHAAHGVHLFDNFPGRVGHILGQLFHHVATGPGVDHAADVRLFLDDELRAARNTRRELGGQRNGFVKAIGMQALRAAKYGCHGFDGGAHHVVIGVLLGQAPAASLAVGAQHQALGRFGIKALHDAAPEQARGAHLGHF